MNTVLTISYSCYQRLTSSDKLKKFSLWTLLLQAAIQYFKETTIEMKLLQMANVYMEEADFDDSDTWFHDGKSDDPIDQKVNVEVTDKPHVLVLTL